MSQKTGYPHMLVPSSGFKLSSALSVPESAGVEGLRAALKLFGLPISEGSCARAAPRRTLPAL